MIAFHEAIQGFTRERGAFLSYAALLIRSRLIDYQRKEARHQGHISLDAQSDEDDIPLYERLADDSDHYEESAKLQATQQEIAELSLVLTSFGVSFTDIADNSPKQERTLEACGRVVRHAAANKELLEELLKTKKHLHRSSRAGFAADGAVDERRGTGTDRCFYRPWLHHPPF